MLSDRTCLTGRCVVGHKAQRCSLIRCLLFPFARSISQVEANKRNECTAVYDLSTQSTRRNKKQKHHPEGTDDFMIYVMMVPRDLRSRKQTKKPLYIFLFACMLSAGLFRGTTSATTSSFPRGEFPVTTVWFGGLEALGITESDRRFQIGSLQRFCWAVFIGSMAPQLKTITATKKQSD